MNLSGYKIVFVTIGLIGILLTVSLGFIFLFDSSYNELKYTQLYILDPEHKTENYPYNINSNKNYSLYVGVANHMAASNYYVLYVKIRNQTDSLPNATMEIPSSLDPLCEYRLIISNEQKWEHKLTFSFSTTPISENRSFVSSLIIDGISYPVNKPSLWNTDITAFNYELLFELWVYNNQIDAVDYMNRFVALQLNMTSIYA